MWWWLGGGMWGAVGVASFGFWVSHHRLRTYRPPRAARGEGAPGPYAYAYLVGGPRQVARTALTALRLAGLVTVVGNRIVRADGAGRDLPAGPVEAAALALCRPGRGRRGTATEQRVGGSRAVRRVGASLGEGGLIPHPRLTALREGWGGVVALTDLLAFPLGMIALGSLDDPRQGTAAAWTSLSLVPAVISLVLVHRAPSPSGKPAEAVRRPVGTPPSGASATDRVLYEVAAHGTAAAAMPQDLRRALWRPAPSEHVPDDPPGLGGAGL
ncbi:TIGR04222 domain-containing membrane protein [Streptomyces sp. NPDC001744]|uniref:TIGR04222 domain-containing membrane protein n=1 Tax=Streptomyces sp. NPDC001744 TaxID=3364606 RepID=UPI0036939CF2